MIDPKSSSWNEARFILVQFSFLKWIEALVNLTGIYAFAPLISGVTTTLLLWTPCLRHIHWAINLISSAVDTSIFISSQITVKKWSTRWVFRTSGWEEDAWFGSAHEDHRRKFHFPHSFGYSLKSKFVSKVKLVHSCS